MLISVAMLLLGCDKGGSMAGGKSLPMNSQIDSISYAFGMSMSKSMIDLKKNAGEENAINLDLFFNGVQEGNDDKLRLTEKEMQAKMGELNQIFQAASQKKSAQEGAENTIVGEKFLAENAKKEGVKTTASGLQYKVLQEGKGAMPTAANKVSVHYTGKLLDGTVFDSSVERGQPIEFAVTGVIPGWTEGLQLMKVGSKYEMYIPGNLAYGPRGTRGIAPNSVLIFEVELLGIVE